jgi:A/G-specific adenine glycosylase
MTTTASHRKFQTTVLEHYRRQGRHDLPWRRDVRPYYIVVSEIMLQQTQVDRVVGKFRQWIKLFPKWKQLAAAQQSEVLRAWKGLGYNSRALRLHRLAQIVSRELSGKLPQQRKELEALPGIGPYTAGAVRAFAFDQADVFIETNIRRAYIHYYFADGGQVSDTDIFPLIQKDLELVLGDNQVSPRTWYWALMDYGSYLGKILPKNPNKRSRHYAKQTKFEGSDRQIRGKILDILLSHKKLAVDQLHQQLVELSDDNNRINNILDQLITEGFVNKVKNQVSLV